MIGRVQETVIDCADPSRLARFWAAVLGGVSVDRAPDWSYVDPPGWTRLAFQQVPERKASKNRLHLDVEAPDLAAAAAATQALGGRCIGSTVTDDYGSFQVMADPEGNEWCLVLSPAGPLESRG